MISTRAMRPVLGRVSVPGRLSITAAMVIAQPVFQQCLDFSGAADLCKEMSTKSNDNARCGRMERPHPGAQGLSSRGRFFKGAALRLAWLSGVARLMERRRGGAGAILRFEH